jgi:hypothetical protein
MAGKLGSAGPATFWRAPPFAMELKDPHIKVDPTTGHAVVEGKCPSCYCVIRRPVSSFKRLGYLCVCGTTVTPPHDVDALLASAIKQARRWQSQN